MNFRFSISDFRRRFLPRLNPNSKAGLPTRVPKSAIGGFTLIEVVIAIAILSLIVGGVMASVSACLQSVEIVRQERTQQVQRDALHSLLQRNLMAVPMDAVIRCRPGVGASGGPPALQLRARQPAFVFTSNPWKPGRSCESALMLRREADGSLTLGGGVAASETADFFTPERLAGPTFPWIPLVRGIRKAQWRFFDSAQDLWLEQWDRQDIRPTLIELQLEFMDASTPFRGVFWLPASEVSETATGRNDPVANPSPEAPASTLPEKSS